MKENREWNPYYMNSPYTMNPEQRAFPWLYPYGNQMNYWSLWNSPERMEDEMDTKRLTELYPLMARRMQPYVEEVCNRLEYQGSMMYDEYPDQLSLLKKASEVWDLARAGEDFGIRIGFRCSARQGKCGSRRRTERILAIRRRYGNSFRI